MEDSPLTLAHQHAVQASNILSSSSSPHSQSTLIAAASSHALAATSFASAAKTTRDPEAHRTLELLVAEHTRWAERLKRQAEAPTSSGGLQPVTEASDSEDAGRNKKDAVPPIPQLPFAGTPHYPARLQKSTSSLATNLASARGIPPPRSAASAAASSSSSRRRSGGPLLPDKSPSSSKPTTNPLSLLPPDEPSTDASFSKFYSSLNSLITKIGSPFTASLAFTGLPVGTAPTDNEISPDVLPKGWTQGRGRGRNLGLNDVPGAGGESFYVVPYSGGTMSYANVVQRTPTTVEEEKDKTTRHSRSYPTQQSAPSSPRQHRDEETAKFAGHDKTLEELQLENSTLRRTLEHVSRKMNHFEQKTRESEKEIKSSILALSKTRGAGQINDIFSQAQRRSWLHVPNEDEEEETYSEGRRVGELEAERETVRDMETRVKLLEQELRSRNGEMERIRQENEKLTKVKERWDALREGAKKRERNSRGGTKLAKVSEAGGG
ncbi:hypothetical protein K440DRAFT_618441 [Wilcoxina mikolae CBS 423.85]|nr:hypothetical protein K440DRAFT_618441 [Wilcoxina mikolae CBS 423.85]